MQIKSGILRYLYNLTKLNSVRKLSIGSYVLFIVKIKDVPVNQCS